MNIVIREAEKYLNKTEILVWLRPLKITETESEILVLYKNKILENKLKENKFSVFFSELQKISGKQIKFKLEENDSVEVKISEVPISDDFFKTKENSLALKAFEALFLDEQKDLNPIFIYGKPGVGKSTLGKKFLEYSKNSKNLFSEDFVNDFFKEIKTGENKFKDLLNLEIFVLDNIEFFEKRVGAQLKLCLIIDKIISNNGKILFISSRSKDDLKLDPRLLSRLFSGLTLQIRPPSKDTIDEFLKKSGILTSPNNSINGFRELKSFCVTETFLKQNPSPEITSGFTPEEFFEKLLKQNSISKTDLKQRKFVNVKDKIIFELKEAGVSFVKIAELIGLSNHSSCIYAYNKFNSQLANK